jgi:hypothetical protein
MATAEGVTQGLAPGHKQRVYQRPSGRWYAECSCGYESTGRTSEVEAAKTAIYHARQVMKARIANGRLGVSLDDL